MATGAVTVADLDDKFSYRWSVPKSVITGDHNVRILSPTIPRRARQWQLHGWPAPARSEPSRQWGQIQYGHTEQYKFCLQLCLLSDETSLGPYRVQIKYSVLDQSGKEVSSIVDKSENRLSTNKCSDTVWVELPHGLESTVTFLCEVEVYKEAPAGKSIPQAGPSPYKSTVLASARKEGLFTDFTLVVEGREIQAHKFVLAARSPVFRRMIETPMRESSEARVTIDDFSAEVVEEMVTFMYSDRASNLQNMTKELVAIADKYQLQDLKLVCGKELDRCLAIDNAAETLLLAIKYNIEPLKSACIKFIAVRYTDVQKTSAWATIARERQPVYVDVLEELCAQFCVPPALTSVETDPPPAKRQCMTN